MTEAEFVAFEDRRPLFGPYQGQRVDDVPLEHLPYIDSKPMLASNNLLAAKRMLVYG
jgi:hypothetical protein